MKLSDFWDRMNETFGQAYARSVAADHSLGQLGGRTIDQALADGENAKAVWMAVCRAWPERVPSRLVR
ncbi:DUF3046 domain-containing protein [Glycomyces albidus]|jgi:hypothetical protein|uniref:DUF3046 domain-containing protein n=1 Tax=Glycomyces albidus TaxID=2656774 RepID=A0A6L5GAT3_9ACTN|nr:DUF3046 domain-containing protein [Glycomyces albidus]MQM26807.1 DUF3046 domain-containing protein [Glycomyces albidus]